MQYVKLERVNKGIRINLNGDNLGVLDKRDIDGIDMRAGELDVTEILVTDAVADVLFDAVVFKACDICIRMLAVSEYAPAELRFKLRFRGFGDSVIDRTIERLYAQNHINDERYVESFVRSYARKKGKRMISLELEQKGLGLDSFDEIIDRVYAEEGITESAVRDALLEKKFRGADPEDPVVISRKKQFLYRKGFSQE